MVASEGGNVVSPGVPTGVVAGAGAPGIVVPPPIGVVCPLTPWMTLTRESQDASHHEVQHSFQIAILVEFADVGGMSMYLKLKASNVSFLVCST